jgi:DNA invertase Pin-like site-specific DNA recombinase
MIGTPRDATTPMNSNATPVRAAQYVRMSTENQQYSIDNQSEAIHVYAREHNMEIVRTYADAGKSGLTLENRSGLTQLIKDVETGSPGYSAVLVYDVSRWGRFQDADESAYYEYRCRRVNIAVHYCAESFPNDGSLTTAVVKAMKRAMAAEYSRELSRKVFAGQARLTDLGFRQGGLAGYGLRRLLVDQHGKPKFVLERGEQKSIATDRVKLIPGPPHEVEIVREIFRMYACDGLSPVDIAKRLNDRGVIWDGTRPWTRFVIRGMVTNPKYVGANVSNRFSGKLRSRRSRNAPEMWIRRDDAFPAIVDTELFRQAEAVAAARVWRYSDEQLLQRLREFLAKNGELTERSISADLQMPCSQMYNSRFGGLVEAYRRIGYQHPRNLSYVERDRKILPIRKGFTETVVDELTKGGASVRQDSRTKLLWINETLSIRVAVMRCRSRKHPDRWIMRLSSPVSPDATVVARLKPGNETILDYFCIPLAAQNSLTQLTLRAMAASPFDVYRYTDLAFLRDLVANGACACT